MPTISVTATVTDAAGHSAASTVTAVIGFATERAFRESLVEGAYDPDPTNTGCYDDPTYPAIARAVVTNHVPAAGQTYSNLIIQNQITPPVGAGQAWYRNCELQGPVAAGHLVKAYDAGRIVLNFIDCTFRPQVPDSSRVGAIGRNYTWLRCRATHVVDGFRVQDTNDPDGPCGVSIRQSYVNDLYWEADAADGTHSDDGQISSGSGLVVRGNTLLGFIAPEYRPNFYGTKHANAVLMIKPDVGMITGVDIQFNLMDGGAFAVNLANKTSGSVRTLGNVGTISNNRFGRDIRQTRPISMPLSASATVTTGNTYADNGSAAPVTRQG